MDANATIPFGNALHAYFNGESDVEFMLRRDDGVESLIPVEYFFRTESKFSAIERTAIDHCSGHVLDIGAGTGVHSLALEAKGLHVTAIDINPQAADIMRQRGVHCCRQADVFKYQGGPFDTLFMMGHGIGIVENLEGLSKFLAHARELTKPGGQLILDSLDVSSSTIETDIAYHEKNRKIGRYIGEIEMQFEFRDTRGPFCPWLHVDYRTLEEYATKVGWMFKLLIEIETGEYLARLQKIRMIDDHVA